jgi:hypothetical protein
MIRRFILAFALLMLPLPAFAASFTATVDSANIMTGESVSLLLTLTGAQPKGNPDTQVLAKDFDIVGQAQTSETSIINGAVSSNQGWQLTLLPKHDGHVTIPPVSIETSSGSLATQPVVLDIGGTTNSSGGSSSAVKNPQARAVPATIAASVDTDNPYQNQPVLYTLRVVAHDNLSNLSLGDVIAEGAIVQPQGKAMVTDSVENGQPVKVIEFRYLITPVQAKEITIAPVKLQGSVESEDDAPNPGHINKNMMDPFALFQSMGMGRMPGFATMRPFSVASNAVELKTRAPAVAMDPWLPLKNLRIEQSVEPQQPVKVGDSFTRTLTLLADGMGGSQLPNLEQQLASPDYKIYADKPKTEDSIVKNLGSIAGRREESFNLIPLKAGRLTLPAVKLAWWDVKTDRIAYAEAPEQVVDVLPSVAADSAAVPNVAAASQPPTTQTNAAPPEKLAFFSPANAGHYLAYAVSAGLLIVLLIVGFIFKSSRKIKTIVSSNTTNEEGNPAAHLKDSKTIEPDWDRIHDPAQLNKALMDYIQGRWKTPRHISLEALLSRVIFTTEQDQQEAISLSRDLAGALYGGKEFDMVRLKSGFRHLLNKLANTKPVTLGNTQTLPPLNPS